MINNHKIHLIGVPGSPYTRKMLALLRFRHINHLVTWGQPLNILKKNNIEPPKPVLLPVCLFEGDEGVIAKCDSTPIIRAVENDFTERSVIPSNPVLSFLNYLIEDFADEWVTKYMFHYRWHFKKDINNAGDWLPFLYGTNTDQETYSTLRDYIVDAQTSRLWVVGSNETTAPIIEASYLRILGILEKILAKQSFLFGDRPSSADFGIFGQLTQLVNVDPTSRALAEKQSMRTVAWVDLMEDLSGISDNTPWMKPESVQPILNDLLIEIGKTYVPAMLANAEAISANQDTWSNQICGSDWSQKTFPYQAKCLNWVREEFNRLNQEDKDLAVSLLKNTGCENLFKE